MKGVGGIVGLPPIARMARNGWGTQLKAAILLHAHCWLYGETGTQGMVGSWACQVCEVNANGDALDHLDVVAGGVFRWEQRQDRTSGPSDLGDLAVVRRAGRVGSNLDSLTRRHVAQLGLLKVCGDPQILKGNEGEQVLASGYVLFDFDALAGDDSGNGCDDFGVAEVELRLIELSLCLSHLRLRLFGVGTLGGDLLRACFSVLQLVFGLGLVLARYPHHLDR